MKTLAILDDYQDAVRRLPYWKRLSGRVAIDVFHDTLQSEDALVERLKPYAIVVAIRERTRFTASLLGRLPALEHLAITGRNSGHVDLEAATKHGVLVTATGGSGAGAIEHTLALILAVVRRVPQEDRAMREGRWQTTVGVELSGKTLGIAGLGRIGSRVAAFGQFLGMRVVAWGPTLTDERARAAGVTRVDLDELFRQSDVVSLHLLLSDTSRGIVTGRHLALMKPSAYLVNTARGPLIDETALVAALRERRIAGAALDVYDVEPLPRDHPLLALDNVVLTPHLGYVTEEGYRAFFGPVAENVESWLNGETPKRALNPQVLAGR